VVSSRSAAFAITVSIDSRRGGPEGRPLDGFCTTERLTRRRSFRLGECQGLAGRVISRALERGVPLFTNASAFSAERDNLVDTVHLHGELPCVNWTRTAFIGAVHCNMSSE